MLAYLLASLLAMALLQCAVKKITKGKGKPPQTPYGCYPTETQPTTTTGSGESPTQKRARGDEKRSPTLDPSTKQQNIVHLQPDTSSFEVESNVGSNSSALGPVTN